MIQVFISIGSNIQREKNIHAGVMALNQHYSKITCSQVYESISIGFDGDNFYNLVVGFLVDQDIESLSNTLTAIEDENARDRSGPRFSPRTLDLDLLLYGNLILKPPGLTLPRPEIYENAFVLQPLAEISGNITDPLSGKTFQMLWQEFDKEKQRLWPIEFSFNLT